ncbi:MAG TPA: sugar transferase [Aggregatilineaceae bacterium]|nr:sugar transferase [Aggregatilineaceae bacterium]
MNNAHRPYPPPPRRQLQVSERRLLLMIGDVIAILLAVLLALGVWVIVDNRGLGFRFILTHSYWFPILAAIWLLIASANDFYNLRITAHIDTSLLRLAQVTSQIVVVYLVIFFFSPRAALPRLFIFYYAVLSFVFIVIWRVARPALFGRTAARRALVIGSGWTANTMIEALRQEAPDDYDVIGLIIESRESPPNDSLVPMIGTSTDLLTVARRENVAELILAHGSELSGEMFQSIMDCYEQGFSIVPMPLLYEQVTGRVPVEHVGQRYWTTMLPIEGTSIFDPYPLLKRAMDILSALVGLFFFLLLLPFIALAMYLDSPGPIFYRQERVGQGGRIIKVIKLRSMIPDAERESGPKWATEDDPRITRMGKLMRKTRLDEVPQFFNVLRGDMSLIGPRPERPQFVQDLSQNIPFYRTRHVVKPGITGWAQVRYPYGSSEEDALMKLQYDLYYIRHHSLALDLLIMLRTVGKMLSFQGT